jgi:hypothetical protein
MFLDQSENISEQIAVKAAVITIVPHLSMKIIVLAALEKPYFCAN